MASVTFPTTIGGDGSTVTDDSNASTGLGGGGHRTRFVPALAQLVAVANFMVNLLTSALNGASTGATSTTSLTIATGAQSLTLAQTGKAFSIGQTVVIASTAGATNQMIGIITAFNSGTGAMTVQVSSISGSGTIASWTVAVSASAGVASSRLINVSGLVTGGGDLSADRTVTVTAATGANVQVGTSTTTAMTPKALADSMAPVSVSYAASVALDLSTGFNFDIGTLTGNITLANPSNAKVGQSGRIRLTQDGTGSRTITYGSWFKGVGGAQTLSTAINTVDLIAYFVRDATTIEYTMLKAVA